VFRDDTPAGFKKSFSAEIGGPRGNWQKEMNAGLKQTNCLVPETKQLVSWLKASCDWRIA
jgi:hypothetical protein